MEGILPRLSVLESLQLTHTHTHTHTVTEIDMGVYVRVVCVYVCVCVSGCVSHSDLLSLSHVTEEDPSHTLDSTLL